MATDAAPEGPLPAPIPGQSVIVPADPERPRKLSDEFAMILREFEVETVTLREVLGLLHGRGYVLLVMLLALPFCQPIPLPGLSTPLGLIIVIIGVRLALGHKPWLPARLLETRLPPELFARVFKLTQKIVSWFERFLRPRMLQLTATPRLQQLHAVPIVICAALLLLPVPIPLSNVFPAWGVLLICGGLLERDGKFILAGYAATVASLIYFALCGSAMAYTFKQAWEHIVNWFN
ncbi:MAG TPA: exopolysaccharide biosynthesis protein [Opitutaceae bacterium]|nr:exopolysaccharide biosynthesis protein [Opitutaceae bacterium]